MSLQFGLGSLFELTAAAAVVAWISPAVSVAGLAFVAFLVTVTFAWLIGVMGIAYVLTQVAQYAEQLFHWIGRNSRRGLDSEHPPPPGAE